MTATTIKVDSALRDRLKQVAAQQGVTMSGLIEDMLAERLRDLEFAALREAMAANPPDEQYMRETREWTGSGWL